MEKEERLLRYRRQIEGFAETILSGAPQYGAGVEDGVAAMRAMVRLPGRRRPPRAFGWRT